MQHCFQAFTIVNSSERLRRAKKTQDKPKVHDSIPDDRTSASYKRRVRYRKRLGASLENFTCTLCNFLVVKSYPGTIGEHFQPEESGKRADVACHTARTPREKNDSSILHKYRCSLRQWLYQPLGYIMTVRNSICRASSIRSTCSTNSNPRSPPWRH